MVNFTSGNMFAIKADIRVNTVNCVGIMGAGVALSFKVRYLEMFEEYRRRCQCREVQVGQLDIHHLDGLTIVNLPTKVVPRKKSQYEWVESGLKSLHEFLKGKGLVRVTLPALGCGHGGLDWDRVKGLIKDCLTDLDAQIFVFTPQDSRDLTIEAKSMMSIP